MRGKSEGKEKTQDMQENAKCFGWRHREKVKISRKPGMKKGVKQAQNFLATQARIKILTKKKKKLLDIRSLYSFSSCNDDDYSKGRTSSNHSVYNLVSQETREKSL